MIIDKRGTFDDAHAYTGSAASTDYLDLQSDRDIGVGQMVWMTVQLDAAADSANGDETYSLALQTDDNSSFSSASDIATITIPRGTAAGTRYCIGFPRANEQYVRTYLTCGGTTPSVTLSTYIGDQPASWQAYPDAI